MNFWQKFCRTLLNFKKRRYEIRTYKGKRIKIPGDLYPYGEKVTASDYGVKVTVNGEPLRHRVYHSPTGFEWGYGGSGPADLARSILWDYLEKEPARVLYQNFKDTFVAVWRGDEWQITSREIQDWIKEKMNWEDVL